MATVVYDDFEWDDAKAERNVREHDGITFQEAASVFGDAGAVFFESGPPEENRTAIVGYSHRARLLLVVHVERGERTRIISARKADKHEAKLYARR